MNRIRLATVILCLLAAFAAAGEPAFQDGFEQGSAGWKFGKGSEYPGAQGLFERTTDAAHEGSAAGKIVGDFSGGGRYVHITRDFDVPQAATGVTLWVQAGNVRHLLVRVRDESGQTHQHHIRLKETAEWQQITLANLAGAQQKWGGANDGKWHGKLTQLAILLEKDGITADPPKASLLIDDVQVLAGDAPAPAPAADDAPAAGATAGKTSYDFEDGLDGWKLSLGGEFKGAQGTMQRTTAFAQAGEASLELAADFSQGGRYIMAMCQAGAVDVESIRFWVRPVDLNKVLFRVVDSTGQTFQHEVSVTPNGQWQEIHVTTLRSRNKWGGANDGEWHGPMKEFAILLERPQIVDQKTTASLGIDNVRFIVKGEVPQAAVVPFELPLGVFDDANDGWWHHHDNKVQATLSRDADGHSGAALYASIRFDGGNWYTLLRQFDQEFDVRRLRFQVKADNIRSINVSLLNVTGQEFSRRIDIQSAGAWQAVDLADIPVGNARISRNDGKLFGAAAAIRVSVEAANRIDPSQPVRVWIDDVAATLAGEGVFYTPRAAAVAADGIAGTLTMPRSLPIYWKADDAPAGVVTFRFQNGSDQPVELPPIELLNHELRTLAQLLPGGEPVAPGSTVEKTFDLSVPQFGHYTIHTAVAGKPLRTRLAWIVEEGQPDIDGPFGIHHHLSQGPWGRAQYIGDGSTVVELTRKLGAAWIREDIRGRFDDNDNLLGTDRHGYFGWPDAAKARGMGVIGTYFDFMNLNRAPRTDDERARFARRFTQIVDHYKDVVDKYEVWNEPNIEPGWRSRPNPEDYAKLIEAAYPAIKAADPEAFVIGVTSAGTDFPYIERVLQAGGARYMDALSVHPYHGVAPERRNDRRDAPPVWMGTGDYQTFLERIETVTQLLKRHDGENLPIYATEMGSGNKDPDVEWRDTCHLVRQYLLGMTLPQLRMQVTYNFQDQGFNEDEASHMTFGLFRADGSPEPRAVAYNTMARLLYKKRFVEQLDLGEGIYAYRFSGETGDTLVIWTVDEGRTIGFSTSQPRITVVDLMGNERHVTPVDQRVTLAATGAPLFVLNAGPIAQTEDLAPTLENLATQPGKGDSVAEYDIIELFHKASHALWDYMHLRERRTAAVHDEPEPPHRSNGGRRRAAEVSRKPSASDNG